MDEDKSNLPEDSSNKWKRAGMNAVAGAIPFVGGILSAAASAWSESEQEAINKVFQQWKEMLEEELREKSETIIDIMARLDMQDEEIKNRISSNEYQALLKKLLETGLKSIPRKSEKRCATYFPMLLPPSLQAMMW